MPNIGKSTETEEKSQVARAWGRRNRERQLNGSKGSFQCDKNALEIVVTVAQHCEYAECYRIVHFKMASFMYV